MLPPEQPHRAGDDRKIVMRMRNILVMMRITAAMMIVTMMRMTIRAKLTKIVVAMPSATDERVSVFAEAGPMGVFPNAAKSLARKEIKATVKVRRDDVHDEK